MKGSFRNRLEQALFAGHPPKDALREQTIWSSNREAIEAANRDVLERTSFIVGILMLPVCLVNLLFVNSQSALIYAVLSAVSFLMYFYCRCVLPGAAPGTSVIGMLYVYVSVILAFSIVVAYYIEPYRMTAAYIVTTACVSLIILDKPARMRTLYFVACVAFCASAAWRLSLENAMTDITTCCLCTVFGLFIGAYVRAIKLSDIEARRALAEQGRTDILTGLANRRSLFEYLAVLEGPEAEDGLSGVLMLDVDFFKEYNDHYGHQAGDECLRRLGALMTRFGEEHGLRFFRYGGEEFLGTSTHHDDAALGALAQALLCEVSALDIPYDSYDRGHITVSIGYAHVTEGRRSGYEKCISQADAALYAAKGNGRCCVVGYTGLKPGAEAPPQTLRQRR